MKKRTTVHTCSGHDIICTLHQFPYLELLQGLVALMFNYKIHLGRNETAINSTADWNMGVQLAYDALHKRWWLYYPNGNVTGGFDNKKKAIAWFVNGSR